MQTILIVDDQSENIDFLRGVLSNHYKCKAAPGGKAAIKIMQLKEKPDLVLLDLSMPDIDGLTVTRMLKKDPTTRDIPIIFVTSHTDEKHITQGFEAGGVDYITKPFNPRELIARIETHLTIVGQKQQMQLIAEQLGKYMSPEVYSSIFTGARSVVLGSATKNLTVFFSDIVNFSGTVESMNHEELTHWLNRYLNAMAELTIEFGGTLDKFIGDAVMVFFGDPRTKGETEDALLCLRMAKRMIEVSGEMGIDIRIGINSGSCTIGNFGSENRMDYSILGNEVNVAARLESNSEPGRILISESTWEMVKGEINCIERGEITVKNIKQSIRTFWAE
ncbi:MAG: response regulator [Fibrobacterales bacterium]